MRLFLFSSMLQFKQDDTSATMILTLTELVSINEPNYLFVFTNVTTKEVVKFVKSEVDDESEYPMRYNQFTIDAADVFENKQPGEWHYKVYEQSSAINTEEPLAGAVIEYGKLILDRPVDFSFTQYQGETSFKVYNG